MKAKNFKVGDLILDYECEPYTFEVEEIKKNEQGVLAVYYRNGSCMATDAEPAPLNKKSDSQLTDQEKERIDYEVQAKIKARDKNLGDWGCAIWLGSAILFLIWFFIVGISSLFK